MAYKKLPSTTADLIKELDLRFPDVVEILDLGPFERGKQVGVVQLLRELKQRQGV